MSQLEELLISAEQHGKRHDVLDRVKEIKESLKGKSRQLSDIYQQAYDEVVLKE